MALLSSETVDRSGAARDEEPPGGQPRASVPLVLLHGFTQTRRLWGPFGELIGAGRRRILVDLPGHGGSSAVRAALSQTAHLVAATIDESEGEGTSFDLVGYSLGARVALHVAMLHPARVARLVLIGGTPGIRDPAARARRRARDEAMADDLEVSGDLGGFVRRWLATPMFATLGGDAARTEERLRNTPAGLASSLRLAGTGTQEPLWDHLRELAMPVLSVVGADDPRFVVTNSRMAVALPRASLSLVTGAGHAAHLAQPALAGAIVRHWLERTPTSLDETVPPSARSHDAPLTARSRR